MDGAQRKESNTMRETRNFGQNNPNQGRPNPGQSRPGQPSQPGKQDQGGQRPERKGSEREPQRRPGGTEEEEEN